MIGLLFGNITGMLIYHLDVDNELVAEANSHMQVVIYALIVFVVVFCIFLIALLFKDLKKKKTDISSMSQDIHHVYHNTGNGK